MSEDDWNITHQTVEDQVDSMLAVLKDAGAEEQISEIVNKVYRSYVRWLYAARVNRVSPEDAYSSAINLVNGIILETMTQMASSTKGKKSNRREWAEGFIEDLLKELDVDLTRIESGSGPH